jgi:NADPH2:quinone reductase
MQKVRAIRFNRTGGPEVLTWEEVTLGSPAAGQVTIKHTAVGLNFIDVYHRTGLYPAQLPSGIGLEAAGVVETVSEGVADLAVGDRVAYGTGPIGAYSESRNIAADKLIKIPEGIEDRTAAAIMLKGLTAQYLLRRTYRVKAGDTILVHAAAGGVGLLLSQWAKHLGATVIGTVGSTAKGELARAHGCDHTILYRVADVAKRVRELTGGAGVPVVYDGVGKDTFASSLDSLAPLGMMVSFGNASGPVASFDPLLLSQKGSLFFTRPTLMHYTAKRDDLVAMATELFDVVKSGAVKIEVNQTYRLFDAAHAHRDLESRKTTGSSVLIP